MTLIRELDGLASLRNRPRRLLAVFAHPDDEAYGSAGALARAGADPDAAVVLLTLTHGEASTLFGETPRLEIAAIRAGRMVEVAERTGADALLVLDLPDGRLARLPLGEVSARISAVVEEFRPQVVIGNDPRGANGHADHIAAHWAIRHALRRDSEVRFAMVAYTADDCEAVKPRLLFPTKESDIDATLWLSEAEIDAKEACLRAHDALVTLRRDGDPRLFWRPPVERYDFLGESLAAEADDLFAGIRTIG